MVKEGQQAVEENYCRLEMPCAMKNKSETWVPLKDLKESHPVETAEYARSRNIADEPAFTWWVPYTLRKRDVILAAVKSRVRKTTHKYVDEANGNHFWRDAIAKEMTNVGVAFEVLPSGKQAPIG